MTNPAVNKVVHITTVHPPSCTRIYHKQCKSLAAFGYKVVLLAPSDLSTTDITVKKLKNYKSRISRILLAWINATHLALKEKAQLYHFHDPELIPLGLMLRLLGKKVIYDAHENIAQDIMSKQWIPRQCRRFIARFARFLEKVAAHTLTFTITATPDIKKHLSGNSKQMIDVKNYPKLEEFQHIQIDHDHTKKALCYAGLINKDRGLFEMVALAETLSLPLNLCGRFVSQTDYKALQQHSYYKSIHYHGYLNREDLIFLLQESNIGLVLLKPLPNFQTALPVKLFEYMAAGIPVIASNFPVWRSIIEKHHCGICVDPNDPRAILNACQQLLKDPALCKQMGINGKTAVKAHYNWNNESKKLLTVYENILTR